MQVQVKFQIGATPSGVSNRLPDGASAADPVITLKDETRESPMFPISLIVFS